MYLLDFTFHLSLHISEDCSQICLNFAFNRRDEASITVSVLAYARPFCMMTVCSSLSSVIRSSSRRSNFKSNKYSVGSREVERPVLLEIMTDTNRRHTNKLTDQPTDAYEGSLQGNNTANNLSYYHTLSKGI